MCCFSPYFCSLHKRIVQGWCERSKKFSTRYWFTMQQATGQIPMNQNHFYPIYCIHSNVMSGLFRSSSLWLMHCGENNTFHIQRLPVNPRLFFILREKFHRKMFKRCMTTSYETNHRRREKNERANYLHISMNYRKLLCNRDVDRMIMMIFRGIYSNPITAAHKWHDDCEWKKKDISRRQWNDPYGWDHRLNQKPQFLITI